LPIFAVYLVAIYLISLVYSGSSS